MKPIVAVLCFAVAAQAKLTLPRHMEPIVTTQGKQYELYSIYTSQHITLTQEDQKETFSGLDANEKNEKVDRKDLDMFYWYADVKYAIKKFFNYIDDDNNEIIQLKELDNDFKKKAIKVALVECHYLKSLGLRESCFADQLLTYVSLVLDENDVKSFFTDISGGDEKFTAEEAQKLPKAEDSVAEELGGYFGGDGLITYEEFDDYVTQESINDDFRRCRSKVDVATGNVDFTNECLKEELVEYANDDLTEMDISVLFRAVDKDNSKAITKAEIDALPGIDGDEMVKRAMKLLDMSLTTQTGTEASIDYGEFRTYMKSPTVQIQMERVCTEKMKTQKDELDCLFDLFVSLVKHSHSAIWLVVPDLDQQITFEILDEDDNGVIKEEELPYVPKTNKRFIEEIDTIDEGKTVDLEEFNEYVDIPHMVYGMGVCLLKPRLHEEGRVECYPEYVGKVLHNIRDIEDSFWDEWFETYESSKDDNRYIDIHDDKLKAKVAQELIPLFLAELGQGDATVSLFEFKWYVKQRELALRYKDNFDGNTPNVDKFHEDLLKWIEDDITEYDVQEFFRKMDRDGDHELSQKDFEGDWAKVQHLMKHIDGLQNDHDDNVNFREFWLWMNSNFNKAEQGPRIKDVFERECTKAISGANQQEKEIECYVKILKEKAAWFLS